MTWMSNEETQFHEQNCIEKCKVGWHEWMNERVMRKDTQILNFRERVLIIKDVGWFLVTLSSSINANH